MSERKKAQGRPIPLPSWWLLEFQARAKGFTDEQIANMANAVDPDRIVPWDRSTVGRFRRGKNPTLELTRAMCKVFHKEGSPLYPPVFVANTREEALEMLRVQQQHEKLRLLAAAEAKTAVATPEKTGMQLIADRVTSAFTPGELAEMENAAQSGARKRAEKNLREKKRRQLNKEK